MSATAIASEATAMGAAGGGTSGSLAMILAQEEAKKFAPHNSNNIRFFLSMGGTISSTTTTHGTLMKSVDPATAKVIASTLPEVPGMQIVLTKPIIFGSVAHSCFTRSEKSEKEMMEQVGVVMSKAQEQMLHQAAAEGCNAVLSMTFNVLNNFRNGPIGGHNMVIVTAYGTPCCVAPKE